MLIYLLLGLATFALLFLLTVGIDRMERWIARTDLIRS